jgi:hypothetical protein
MTEYFVNTNAQPNGDHEVHVTGCGHFPHPSNARSLGYFTNCKDAVRESKKLYPKSNGCYFCTNECHTT